MKVFITKYALSSGIQEKEVIAVNENMVKTLNSYTQYFHGKDWHETYESAQKRANEMRIAKIKTIEKKLQLLRELKF